MQKLPGVALVAAVVAFLLGALAVLGAVFGPIIGLPLACIPLIAGVGMLRRRVWSAYGLGVYYFAQALLAVIMALRATRGVAVLAVFGVLLGCLFLLAGRALARNGGSSGSPIPWIAISILTTAPLFFVGTFAMPSASMENTLLIGDRLLVRTFPKPSVQRGDIVVFAFPLDRNQTYIKRIIGSAGDRIRMENKLVYRNGTALTEPYTVHKTKYAESYRDNFPNNAPLASLPPPAQEMLRDHVVSGELVVPDGSYFVLGDNRDDSLDSPYFGFVPASDIIGKPMLIYDSQDQPAGEGTDQQFLRPHRVRWNRLFTTVR